MGEIMRIIYTLMICFIMIFAVFINGCVEQEEDIDSKVGNGTLQLKITDKPSDLDIIYANVSISTVQVHKSGTDNDSEEYEEDKGEYENIDDYDDNFIAYGNGPYFGEVEENISFIGNATGGIKPYNWTWDFGDGNISYDQNATHNYSSDGYYTVNLTVTDNNGTGVIDWFITTATIGEIIEEDDDSNAGWYTIVNESQTFDLIALQNVTEILGENDLSTGKYTQIRLTVEQAEITINSSGTIEIHNMKIPSNKVKLIKAFWIFENEIPPAACKAMP